MYKDPDVQPFWCSLNSNLLSLSHCFQPTLAFSRSVVHLYFVLASSLSAAVGHFSSSFHLVWKISFFLRFLSAASSWAFYTQTQDFFIPPTSILCANMAVSLTQLLHKHLNKYTFSRLRLQTHFFVCVCVCFCPLGTCCSVEVNGGQMTGKW